MKKLFLVFAAVTLLIGVQSCKQKPAEESTQTTDSTTTTVTVKDSTVVAVPAAAGDSRNIKPPTDPTK